METIYFSTNKKLNNVLNQIHASLLKIHATEEESISEIKHYQENFSKETDYNLYQHGNLLIYDEDIRDLYKEYKTVKRANSEQLRACYMRQVGWVARYIVDNENNAK